MKTTFAVILGTSLVLIVLQLTGLIGWNWWIITAPFLVMGVTSILYLALVGLIYCLMRWVEERQGKKVEKR